MRANLSNQEVEAEIQTKGLTAPRITEADGFEDFKKAID